VLLLVALVALAGHLGLETILGACRRCSRSSTMPVPRPRRSAFRSRRSCVVSGSVCGRWRARRHAPPPHPSWL